MITIVKLFYGESMSNNLWELIKTARTEAGLTQQELAELTGVNKVSVARWETDNPKERMAPQMLTLQQIAEATKVPFGEFMRCIINEKVDEELGKDSSSKASNADDDFPVKIWERIRAARINAKMTQEELAKACGVSRATVVSWEKPENRHKRTRRQSLRRIAEVTNTTIEWLISNEELEVGLSARAQKSNSDIEKDLQKESEDRKNSAKKLLMEAYSCVSDHGVTPELYDILKGLTASLKRFHQ